MSSGATITVDASQLARVANRFALLGDRLPLAIGRALNHTGAKARTQVVRALTKQTGLKRGVIVRALKVKKASYTAGATSAFTITSRGGDISLKFFSARETRAGVSAAPHGRRIVLARSFLKGGRFPKRVDLAMGGHVFLRAGAKRLPLVLQKSHVIIPEEMVSGATAQAFHTVVASSLQARLEHELGIVQATGGF